MSLAELTRVVAELTRDWALDPVEVDLFQWHILQDRIPRPLSVPTEAAQRLVRQEPLETWTPKCDENALPRDNGHPQDRPNMAEEAQQLPAKLWKLFFGRWPLTQKPSTCASFDVGLRLTAWPWHSGLPLAFHVVPKSLHTRFWIPPGDIESLYRCSWLWAAEFERLCVGRCFERQLIWFTFTDQYQLRHVYSGFERFGYFRPLLLVLLASFGREYFSLQEQGGQGTEDQQWAWLHENYRQGFPNHARAKMLL